MDGGEGQLDVTSQFIISFFSILMLYMKTTSRFGLHDSHHNI
jgi:hypothetical protein